MIAFGSSSVIKKTNNNTIIKHYYDIPEINNIPQKEIQFLKRLEKNKNIIKLISYSENPYIIELEYAELGKLSKNYKNKSWKIKLNYSFQIINAINFIHNNNIIHGDLNTNNIVVTKDNIIKIIDFGGSKEKGENIETMNTISYCSPEQIRSNISSFESDIFSYGLILLEMVYEKPLFYNYDIPEIIEIIEKHKILDIYPINNINIPSLYRYLIKKCLNSDPSYRPKPYICIIIIKLCILINKF